MKQSSKMIFVPKPTATKTDPSASRATAATTEEEPTIPVDSRDVIKLMMQFCMENNLMETFRALSQETGISCNTMLPHARRKFISFIEKGMWSQVLEFLQQPYLTFSKSLLFKLYEQIILELIELNEDQVARYLFTNVKIISHDLSVEEPSRYKKLEHVISTSKHFDALIAYDGKRKEDIRMEISSLFQQEIADVPASSLLNIIGNAIEFQRARQGEDFDPNTFALLDHTMKKIKKTARVAKKEEAVPLEENTQVSQDTSGNDLILLEKPYKMIKFGKTTKVNCCHFITDYFIVGTTDGFVEIYDYLTGKLNKELAFQASNDLIVHEDSVTCFNTKLQPSGILLASASLDKTIRIWNMLTGKCLLKIPTATAATCICFSDYDNTIISGYPNGSIKVHGLTSGGVELKDLGGHRSFINSILQLSSEKLLSCSSDGSIRLWNLKSQVCERVYTIHSMKRGLDDSETHTNVDLPIHSIAFYPTSQDHLIVCYQSHYLIVLDLKSGKETFKFVAPKEGDAFVSVRVHGQYLYGVTVTNKYCLYQIPAQPSETIEEVTALRVDTIQQHKKPVNGILKHPSESILATYSSDVVCLWK
ncbi:hypothetical protein C9374_006271 [Naegleria lovaniensis]|uniref:WD40 repeat-containing protein SMU1 n=1 Tax=Naegleria lovaniensis TaxID=51637 RepID=A0AA88GMT0_NAELO|nr:uncharacterized protein C9374_006271 [Naegleria lovaniensis]KAG2381282.1 hypothetical protein C9374_006271 [Naegleria lovaniensis]